MNSPLTVWRALPAENRRWLAVYGVGVTAILNAVINGAIAWVSTRGVSRAAPQRLLAVALGAVVTPAIALRAMADG